MLTRRALEVWNGKGEESKMTSQEAAKIVSYDPLTGQFYKLSTGGRCGAPMSPRGYMGVYLNGKRYRAHRLAWLLSYGEWPSDFIDHIDGDPRNNKLSNLREADHYQNMQNRKMGQFPGAYMTKPGRYISYIEADHKRYYLGAFPTAEEASSAYAAAKLRLHTFSPVVRVQK